MLIIRLAELKTLFWSIFGKRRSLGRRRKLVITQHSSKSFHSENKETNIRKKHTLLRLNSGIASDTGRASSDMKEVTHHLSRSLGWDVNGESGHTVDFFS
uniref:Ovule protein n=1 Tax=Steinernema glaseri TaxID=37863 RepID=A0A1I7YMU6_9BILA